MFNDINILNGTLIFPENSRKGHIGVTQGKISQITADARKLTPAEKSINAAGLLVFPGFIDSHVHIRGGVFSFREDFASASSAAAAAGITTLMEMPGCAKPASTLQNFLLRVAEVERDAWVDVALYGGAGADNLDQIVPLAAAGAIGFKTFLMPPVRGREKEFYGLCAAGPGELESVMTHVAKTGLPLTIHCEDPVIVSDSTERIIAQGKNRVRDFCASRPEAAEIKAVERAIRAAGQTGCRTIVAHVSSAAALAMIVKAQLAGVDIHAETCAHYLTFDSDSMDRYGVFARMKPPFRSRVNVDRLVLGYAAGQIEITGSDHAPFTRQEKLQTGTSIWRAPDGLPGLEMTLPLLFRLVEEGKLTYERIAGNTAENTARLFGLAKSKGRLEPGRDADLVLVARLETPEYLKRATLRSKARDCAVIYDGLAVRHKVMYTLVRGLLAYETGNVLPQRGQGRFLQPDSRAAAGSGAAIRNDKEKGSV